MFTLSSLARGAISFTPCHPQTSFLQPGFWLPGAVAGESSNTFGHFFYQYYAGSRYSICTALFAPLEDQVLKLEHNSSWPALRFMLRGHVRVELAERSVKLMQGQLMFVQAPSGDCLLHLTKSNVYEFVELRFAPSALEKTGKDMPGKQFLFREGNSLPHEAIVQPAWTGALLLDALVYLGNHPQHDEAAIEILWQALKILARRNDKEKPLTEQQVENLFAAKEAIKATHTAKPATERWAATAQMNNTYFNKFFQQVFELTPYRYLMYERLKAAKQMKSHNPEMGYNEVSHRCGFNNYKHFRRAYGNIERRVLKLWRNIPNLLSFAFAWETALEFIFIY